MWKITVLLCLMPVVHSEILDDVYGVWTPVVYYPYGSIPYCIEYSMTKDQSNTQCVCADGKKSTLVKIKILNQKRGADVEESVPVTGAATANEVNSLLNVTCTCGDESYKSRSVIRYLNQNYMIFYVISDVTEISYTKDEPNTAQLMAKVLPTETEILEAIKKTPELSNRRGGVICAKEVYDLYKS